VTSVNPELKAVWQRSANPPCQDSRPMLRWPTTFEGIWLSITEQS